jgi:hypothetical protein
MVVLLAGSGCRQLAGLDDPGSVDGAGDDDGAGPLCFGTGLVHVCFDATPTGDLSFAVAVNTDATTSPCATNVTSGGDGLCVVDAKTLTVPAGLVASATGSKPLVIVGADTITIAGTVDVSSKHMASTHGGGADFGDCGVIASPLNGSDAGGAGGSFAGMGGDGGDPNHVSAVASLGEPTTLHGGCPGGNGADNSNRGHGGGAIALIAGNHLEVMGQVDASGAGGASQNDFAPLVSLGGGGGGGSGGMIILDAATITVDGVVFANGGGGAQGGTTGSSGRAGNDPANGAAGTGGSGGGSGGVGGTGGAGTTADGAPGSAGVAGSAGGGGGGGSVGMIRIYGARSGTGTISPPAP